MTARRGFTSPYPNVLSRPGAPRSVALDLRSDVTFAALSFLLAAMTNAAAAATYGVAIDVPLANPYCVGPDPHADQIKSPGAAMSTYPPVLENDACCRFLLIAATPIASGYAPGYTGVFPVW